MSGEHTHELREVQQHTHRASDQPTGLQAEGLRSELSGATPTEFIEAGGREVVSLNTARMLHLQRSIGNIATSHIIQRSRIGRGPSTTNNLPRALRNMRRGTPIERNTAQAIDSGQLRAFYLEDLRTDQSVSAPRGMRGVRHPETNEAFIVQLNVEGVSKNRDIWVSREASATRVQEILIHEANHALRNDRIAETNASSFARYRSEFQAYWVAEYANIRDLDRRASRIKRYILDGYPLLKQRYNNDPAFRQQVDGHIRPDGNVLNSTDTGVNQ